MREDVVLRHAIGRDGRRDRLGEDVPQLDRAGHERRTETASERERDAEPIVRAPREADRGDVEDVVTTRARGEDDRNASEHRRPDEAGATAPVDAILLLRAAERLAHAARR